MRVQTEEWRRFIPGVRMYKGKMTYFYNGEILWDDDTREWLIYSKEERQTWEVIIILPGVEIIPDLTFSYCWNVKIVIMSDSVKRIERAAIYKCMSLKFVRLSTNLEYIGVCAFCLCKALTSIFIPPSCREIDEDAFNDCKELIILSVPRNTTLGYGVIKNTALLEASHFETNEKFNYGLYSFSINRDINNEVNEWIKNLNQAQEFALHRECASMEPPSEDNIYEIIKQQGLPSIQVKNKIGVTALEYLENNPYTDVQIDQHKLMKRLVLDLMGEIIA